MVNTEPTITRLGIAQPRELSKPCILKGTLFTILFSVWILVRTIWSKDILKEPQSIVISHQSSFSVSDWCTYLDHSIQTAVVAQLLGVVMAQGMPVATVVALVVVRKMTLLNHYLLSLGLLSVDG